MRKTPRFASLQQHYVRVREIMGDVLCLSSPTSPTRRTYRAVVEVSALNFLLKAEEEQEALVERYRQLLKSLTFPLQILLRHQRLDLRPYLARIRAQIPHTSETTQEIALPARYSPAWPNLATGLEDLLRQLGSRRTLIERHCYLVIPAPELPAPAKRFLRRKRRQAEREELLARVLQELDIRVEMVQQQLAALGLRSRRIGGEELARFYQSCLVPERALEHPLTSEHFAAVGHLPRVKGRTQDEEPALAHAADDLALLPTQIASQACEEERSPDEASSSLMRGNPRRAPREKAKRRITTQTLPPPDLLRLTDLLAPASLEETRDALCIDGEWMRGIAITAFPREISLGGWLAPLLLHDDILDMVLHIHPQDQSAMMRQLRRRRVSYASTRLWNRRQGRLDDPEVDVAQSDVTRLMSQLASGGERIFEVTFVLLVRASDRKSLDERTERLMALLHTVFLDPVAYPTTFEHAQALYTMLPEGRDELRRTITLDSTSIATTFPFLSNSLLMPDGCLLGMTGAGEPVLLDPWDTSSLENPHAFVGGVTGAGKSYLGKLWLARSLLFNGPRGERCSVIDPDGEYAPLAAALGGTVIRIAPGSEHHLNPFDLLPPGCELDTYLEEVKHMDRLAEKIQDLHSLLDLMLADQGTLLGMREKALLDRALYEVYRRVGISPDPRTHYHQPPLLRDLAEVLRSGACGPDETGLGLRLSRYTEGSLAGLLNSQTNVPLDSHLVVWDVRDMRGDLRPVGIWLIADCLWTQALYQSSIRRALYIDEAASLIEHPEGGRFLANLSRRARKRYLRLVTMTQSPERFVSDEWGSVVASNAAIKILKLQDRTSVKAVANRFGLTRGEEQRLLAFGVQEALLLAGDRRVLLSIRASEPEHLLITTNPVELARRQSAGKEHPYGEISSAKKTHVPPASDTRQTFKGPAR
jgi:type IV secretory pathway VirB4 component